MSRQLPAELTAKNVVPLPDVDLSGKTIIVTGGSSGLGWDTAKHFAFLNASRVILTCRSSTAGTKSIESIKEYLVSKGSKSKTVLEAWELDFASFKSVKAFAEKAEKEVERLDIVVANAGMASDTKGTTVDGLDVVLQVNNIANSYLCLKLLPILEKTAKEFSTKTRLEIISSGTYEMIPALPAAPGKTVLFTLNDQGTEGGGEYKNIYPVSKMFNVLDAETLASKAGPGVDVVSTTPGVVYTSLDRNASDAFRTHLAELRSKVGLTSDEGAGVFVAVAVQEDVPNGAYFHSDGKVREKSAFVQSEAGQAVKKSNWEDYEKIWAEHGLL